MAMVRDWSLVALMQNKHHWVYDYLDWFGSIVDPMVNLIYSQGGWVSFLVYLYWL